MDSNFRWIRPNISLFHVDKTSQSLITILNSGDLAADFYKYAEDYFCAANCVMQHLIEEASEKGDIAKLDLWYFSMLYIYRQSLELILKANIFKVETSDQQRTIILANIQHDLKKALDELLCLKKIIELESIDVNWISNFLYDISQIDGKSDMFRYPFDKDEKILFESQTHISLVATYNNMNKAYSILSDLYKTGSFTEQKFDSYVPKLIIEGGDYYQQSVVGYEFAQLYYYPFFTSYVSVGNFLREKILKDSKKELFFPMCYMYRNAIELGLKRIIMESSQIDRKKALKILKRKKHSILSLWNSIVDEVKKYTSEATLNDVSNYIKEIHDLDTYSDKFRYPCNKKLHIIFDKEVTLDIKNISSCFIELCNFLDYVDSCIKNS